MTDRELGRDGGRERGRESGGTCDERQTAEGESGRKGCGKERMRLIDEQRGRERRGRKGERDGVRDERERESEMA